MLRDRSSVAPDPRVVGGPPSPPAFPAGRPARTKGPDRSGPFGFSSPRMFPSGRWPGDAERPPASRHRPAPRSGWGGRGPRGGGPPARDSRTDCLLRHASQLGAGNQANYPSIPKAPSVADRATKLIEQAGQQIPQLAEDYRGVLPALGAAAGAYRGLGADQRALMRAMPDAVTHPNFKNTLSTVNDSLSAGGHSPVTAQQIQNWAGLKVKPGSRTIPALTKPQQTAVASGVRQMKDFKTPTRSGWAGKFLPAILGAAGGAIGAGSLDPGQPSQNELRSQQGLPALGK